MTKIQAFLVVMVMVPVLAIFSAKPLIDVLDDQNIIHTENGNVRLGKVYAEQVFISFEMINIDSGDVLMSIKSAPENFYQEGIDSLQKVVNDLNEASRDEKKKFTVDTISTNTVIRVRLTAVMEYKSEYHDSFNLILDDSQTELESGTNLKVTLHNAQDYCKKMLEKSKSHSFIKSMI